MSDLMEKADEIDSDLTVDAEPERALFVDMLTRDIDLIPAIMDLLDNSIDGARAQMAEEAGTGPTPNDYWISISVLPQKFSIRDNCGGIDLDVARQYAFRFGRPSAYKGTPGSVGQFGVGMKRALFKLGNYFSIESRTSSTRFEMSVDVDQWVQAEDRIWTFRMTQADRQYDPSKAGRGTSIEVIRLDPSVAEDFADTGFLSQLRESIRFRHQAAMAEGIRLELNERDIEGLEVELLSGTDFKPMNRTFVIGAKHGEVTVRLIAGLTRLDRGDDTKDEGDAEQFRGGTDAGWWVFCNGRLLLMRERSRLTGWGETLPMYHPQYRQFRGYVFLTARSTEDLPWNTTKTGIDEESRVWRRVQAEIKVAGSEVVAIINRMKGEERLSVNPEDTPVILAAKAATLKTIERLDESEKFAVPPPPRKPRSGVARPQVRRIQFDAPLDQFQQISDRLGTTTASAIGRQIFDYFYEREVEE